MGPGKIIGVSVDNVEQALQAERDGADYLGAGPVFATPTKADAAPPIGLDGLAEICRRVSIPVVAIGGITAENAGAVIAAGADGVAVVSAVVAAEDVEEAARRLREAVETPHARRPT
jgi:thiamine-phosphate pyrophosphorylase